MKTYRSHKIVKAAKIIAVAEPAEDDSRVVTIESNDAETGIGLRCPAEMFARGVPAAGDYFVEYLPDGYRSFSPARVFEDGYREFGVAEQAVGPGNPDFNLREAALAHTIKMLPGADIEQIMGAATKIESFLRGIKA